MNDPKTKYLIKVTFSFPSFPEEGDDPARTDRPLNDEEDGEGHPLKEGDGDGSASPSSSSHNEDGDAPTLVPSSLNKIFTSSPVTELSHRAKVSSRSKAARNRANGTSALQHLQSRYINQDDENDDQER